MDPSERDIEKSMTGSTGTTLTSHKPTRLQSSIDFLKAWVQSHRPSSREPEVSSLKVRSRKYFPLEIGKPEMATMKLTATNEHSGRVPMGLPQPRDLPKQRRSLLALPPFRIPAESTFTREARCPESAGEETE